MSNLRYVGSSDPTYTPNGFTFAVVASPHLGGRGDVVVYIPELGRNSPTLPAIVLLHGVCASAWSWAFACGAHVALERAIRAGAPPFALVMPSDGLRLDGTAYLAHQTIDVEQWIVDDVPAAASVVAPQLSGNSNWFLAGLSMGGFGALRLAAKHPKNFRAVAAHSPIASLDDFERCMTHSVGELLDRLRDRDELDLLRSLAGLGALGHDGSVLGPRVRIDCGIQDQFLGSSRLIHQELDRWEILHEYQEFDGGHDNAYWHQHLVDTIAFFGRVLADRS